MSTAPMPEQPPVLLIDLSAIFRACFHAIPADEPISGVLQMTLDGVRRCRDKYPGALVAICCDGKGNWRKELSPEYKAHREKQPTAMYDLLDRVKARLVADAYLLWECDGYEADDLIGTASELAIKSGHHVVIASADKDLCQLVATDVRFLKTNTWDEIGPAEVEAKFGVPPYKIAAWLALTGDKSDGIKGVPGVGPKNAADLLMRHENGIAGIWQALQYAEAETDVFKKKEALAAISTPAIVRALQQNKDTVELALKLTRLKYDAPIKFDEIYEVREQKPITEKDTNLATDEEFDDRVFGADSKDAQGRQATDPPAEGQGEQTKQDHGGGTDEGPAEIPSTVSAPAAGGQSDSPAATTALVAVPVAYELALEPTHLSQAQKLAIVLQESRLFPKLANDAQIFAIIVRGRELGLGALVSLDVFSIVEGRLCPSSHFIIAKGKAHSDCEYMYCVSTSDTESTWATKNRKNPGETRLTYTIEQARKAGIIKPNGAWEKRPAEMLRKTCGAQLTREEYPEAALGLYADVELES